MGEKETEQCAAREKRGACEVVGQWDEEEGDKLMESERKGVRGGGAQRWFLSNPLDTRSVWLRTGSERLRLVEGVQAGTDRKDEGKTKEQICFSSLLLTENKGLEDPETCTFLVEEEDLRWRMTFEPFVAWAKRRKEEKIEKLKENEGTFRKKWWGHGERAEVQIPVYSGSRGPESYYEMLSEAKREGAESVHKWWMSVCTHCSVALSSGLAPVCQI